MSSKILILGNGLVGSNLVTEFKKLGHEVYGCAVNPKPHESILVWVYRPINKANLIELFGEIKPSIVINTIGYKDVEACEIKRVQALQSNVVVVQEILDALATSLCIPAHFIHLSTDYVFDGNSKTGKDGYGAEDTPRPHSFYGLSKYLAEQIIKHFPPLQTKSYIIRTGGLYGQNSPLLTNLTSRLLNNEQFEAYINVKSSPTSFAHLAESIIDIVVNVNDNSLIHVSGQDSNRYEFCVLAAARWDINPSLINKAMNTNTKLPANIVLRGTTYKDKQMLVDRLDALKEHYIPKKDEQCQPKPESSSTPPVEKTH